MAKKSIYLIMVAVFVLAFCITSWAYWGDELKVKSTIPIVYEVDIEVEEVETETSESLQDNTLESEDDTIEDNTKETQESKIKETEEKETEEKETEVEAVTE